MPTKVLYITYDGLTDPLGQSQILPYLLGLAKKGNSIHILSCEKKNAFKLRGEKIKEVVARSGIKWTYVQYTKNPPLISTIYDLVRFGRKAEKIIKKEEISIVHCRSYIAALIGLKRKRKHDLKFIFDIRGFWIEERIEGKIWNLRNPLFLLAYKYFKKKEKAFFREADHIISLTEKAKNIIRNNFITAQKDNITVIPCCADFSHFSSGIQDIQASKQLRNKLKIPEKALIISYLGSLGTWYMTEELMRFFKTIQNKYQEVIFLFITRSDPEEIYYQSAKTGINNELIRIVPAERDELPDLLRLSSVSVFFIRPGFSKQASSPTKFAELLSLGIPVITNAGIGDMNEHAQMFHQKVHLIPGFTDEDLNLAVLAIPELMDQKNFIDESLLKEIYSLDSGVKKYEEVYRRLMMD
jgi:glycosyltransferase involved in cell wall biosynthesis